jgi:hypothetical protein
VGIVNGASQFRSPTRGVAHGVVSEEVGLPPSEGGSRLEPLEQQGHIVHRTGRVDGWTLTAAGREHHGKLLAGERLDEASRTALDDAYDQFVTLNEPFKVLCTEWQTNDHPARCIPELRTVHKQLSGVVQGIGTLERMSRYDQRFERAIKRLDAGDLNAFTVPLSNSYHDVWMQLHQDLLLTLRRERTTADGH